MTQRVETKLEAEEKAMKVRHAAIRAILRNFDKLTPADQKYVRELLQEARGEGSKP